MAVPTVSVLLTSYNLEHFIHEALESIRVQTFQDFELRSAASILRSWIDRCGSLQAALLDRLWKIGGRQLDRGYYDDARETFEAVTACDADARRRMMTSLLRWPGTPRRFQGCAAAFS